MNRGPEVKNRTVKMNTAKQLTRNGGKEEAVEGRVGEEGLTFFFLLREGEDRVRKVTLNHNKILVFFCFIYAVRVIYLYTL
jgi:hypothetical protein